MADVHEFVARSSRWRALRHNRDYVADLRAHAGGPPPLELAPFRLRTANEGGPRGRAMGPARVGGPVGGYGGLAVLGRRVDAEGRVPGDGRCGPGAHSRTARRGRRGADGTFTSRRDARAEDCSRSEGRAGPRGRYGCRRRRAVRPCRDDSARPECGGFVCGRFASWEVVVGRPAVLPTVSGIWKGWGTNGGAYAPRRCRVHGRRAVLLAC